MAVMQSVNDLRDDGWFELKGFIPAAGYESSPQMSSLRAVQNANPSCRQNTNHGPPPFSSSKAGQHAVQARHSSLRASLVGTLSSL